MKKQQFQTYKYYITVFLITCNIFFLKGADPLQGDYSIGDSVIYDFPSLDEAINTLKTHGASGDINFNVFPGTYIQNGTFLEAIPGWDPEFTLSITGMGADSSKVIFVSNNKCILSIRNIPKLTLSNFAMLFIDTASFYETSKCLYYENSTDNIDVKIEHCFFQSDYQQALNLVIKSRVDSLTLKSCNIKSIDSQRKAISITHSAPSASLSNVRIEDCLIDSKIEMTSNQTKQVVVNNSTIGNLSFYSVDTINDIKLSNLNLVNGGLNLFASFVIKNIELDGINSYGNLTNNSEIIANYISDISISNSTFIATNSLKKKTLGIGSLFSGTLTIDVQRVELNHIVLEGYEGIGFESYNLKDISCTNLNITTSTVGLGFKAIDVIKNIVADSNTIRTEEFPLLFTNMFSSSCNLSNLSIQNNWLFGLSALSMNNLYSANQIQVANNNIITMGSYPAINLKDINSLSAIQFTQNEMNSSSKGISITVDSLDALSISNDTIYTIGHAIELFGSKLDNIQLQNCSLNSDSVGFLISSDSVSNMNCSDNKIRSRIKGLYWAMNHILGLNTIQHNEILTDAAISYCGGIILGAGSNTGELFIDNNTIYLENSIYGYGISAAINRNLTISNNSITANGYDNRGIASSFGSISGNTGKITIKNNEINDFSISIFIGDNYDSLEVFGNYIDGFVESGLYLLGSDFIRNTSSIYNNILTTENPNAETAILVKDYNNENMSFFNNVIYGHSTFAMRTTNVRKFEFINNSVSLRNNNPNSLFTIEYTDSLSFFNNIIYNRNNNKPFYYLYDVPQFNFGHNLYYTDSLLNQFAARSDSVNFTTYSFNDWKAFEYSQTNMSQFYISLPPFNNFKEDLRLACNTTLPIEANSEYAPQYDFEGNPRIDNIHPGAYQNDIINHDSITEYIQTCEGETVKLEATILEGATYEWSTGSISREISVNEPGNYLATTNLYCDNYFKRYLITNYEIKADFIYSIQGNEVILSNQSQDAQGYNWLFGDGTESTETNPTHIYENTGYYTIELTASNDCETDKMSVDIEVKSSNIETTNNKERIKVYPIPSNDKVYFKLINPSNQNQLIKIYDVTGQTIYQTIITDQLEISKYRLGQNGIYFYEIASDEQKITGKLILQ